MTPTQHPKISTKKLLLNAAWGIAIGLLMYSQVGLWAVLIGMLVAIAGIAETTWRSRKTTRAQEIDPAREQ
ncbi:MULTISPECIES: hypothetical protein [Silvimonas]|uniref:hypothetical protein n=1 Tax=Silvimonas TaxID=300264 RepID=UPI0024B35F11|nr:MULTISPECIES: hypothetical protein [Silvimonas]MDR3428853.1 hypothetical protein [Silvimonas sp.]